MRILAVTVPERLPDLPVESYGQGLDCMMIPGWVSDRRTWQALVPALADDLRLHMPDLPGCGNAAPDTRAGVGFYANCLARCAQRLELERPLLIGHSLGGLIALQMLADHPGAYRGAICLDPAPIILSGRVTASMMGTAAIIAAGQLERALAVLHDKAFFRAHEPQWARALAQDMAAAADPKVAEQVFQDMIAWAEQAPLARIADPVLIIGADKPQNREADLLKALPGAQLGRTVGYGHFHHLLAVDQIAPMIRAFLTVHLSS